MVQRKQSWEELARLEALAATQQCNNDPRAYQLTRTLHDTLEWYRRYLARKERLHLE